MTGTAQGEAGGTVLDDAGHGVRGVASAALRWLHGHREHFRLPSHLTEAGVDHNTTLKPLGELARLSLTIGRVSPPGGPVRRLAHDLLHFAWHATRQGAVFLELARAEPHATHFLEIYAHFAEAGLRHREFEDFTRLMAGTRSWSATEHEPTRRISVLRARECLALAGGRAGDMDAAEHRTWLGARPEPWAFEGRSGYALTHHVFHVTDWGTRPEGLPTGLAEYLAHWLPAWLDSCLEEEFWDLAGELLAVASSLPPLPQAAPTGNAGPGGPGAEAWQRYAAAQSATGAYAERGPAPVGEDRDTFLACYHATLVAAFASALAAARTPGAAPSADPAGEGAAP